MTPRSRAADRDVFLAPQPSAPNGHSLHFFPFHRRVWTFLHHISAGLFYSRHRLRLRRESRPSDWMLLHGLLHRYVHVLSQPGSGRTIAVRTAISVGLCCGKGCGIYGFARRRPKLYLTSSSHRGTDAVLIISFAQSWLKRQICF